jgi:tetratricopeptide (TPR) repeat protein
MKKIFFLIFFLLFSFSAFAGIEDDTLVGQELIMARDYDTAMVHFQNIEKMYPDSPTGIYGQMTIWQLRMYENQDFRFRDEYEAVMDKFERIAVKTMKNNPSAWDMFICGAGYGMRGFFYMRDHSWIRALGSAVRAIQILKRDIWENKDFIDAYLGIGMYNYWRTMMTREIIVLPFFGDHRREGLDQIQMVIDRGRYANKLARSSMIFVYHKDKNYPKEKELLEEFLKMYPKNIIYRQLLGNLYYATREYDKSIEEYRKIQALDPSLTTSTYYLAKAYAMKGGENRATARQYFNDFLSIYHEDDLTKATKMHLKALEKL